jgi:mannose-6-phosphate isomerase-like protein (cupin superfamily)
MANHKSRRNFLKAAPLVAAVSLPFSEKFLFASGASSAQDQNTTHESFQLISAETLSDAIKKLQAEPGNNTLYASKPLPFSIVLTTEVSKTAKEFEWHEGRDHIFQILEGETKYEVGGTPKGSHNTKPGEWLAPQSEGATTLTLRKGDRLIIPRGTPHKRTTQGIVTFTLISTTG